METILECVGGCADGVQLTPEDPDDWPEYFMMKATGGGVEDWYYCRPAKPKIINGVRVVYYDVRKRPQ